MTLEERIKSAVEAHPENQDLRLLGSGWAAARKRFAEDKSAANRKEWKALEKDLREILDTLDATAQTPAPEPESAPGWRWCEAAKAWPDPVPNANRAHQYMTAMGWQVNRANWYSKSKAEWARPSVDGWPQTVLNKYGMTEGVARPGTPAASWVKPEDKPSKAKRLGLDQTDTIATLTEQLKAARKEGLDLDNALKTLRLEIEQGKFVPASELHEKQIGLAVVIYEHVKDVFAANVPTVIRAAGGDMGLQVPVSQCLRDTLEKGMKNATAKEAFQVLFDQMRN